jgi:hypothetical protein
MVEQIIKETQEHIENVGKFIDKSITELDSRKELHDKTKLEEPEFSTFVEYTPKLKNSTYGSEEYLTFLKEMKPALDHHYSNNRHHPEYHENGINDMNLIDLIEMLCDWKAATLRHDNGDIIKSLDINKERFNISDQLFDVLLNTVNDLKFN